MASPISQQLAQLRWPVEQFYENGKGECGFDHYQGCGWQGLHRHLALVLVAYTFLLLQWRGQEEQADSAPRTTFSLLDRSVSQLVIGRYSSRFSRMSC
jgi:hypothetical protein